MHSIISCFISQILLGLTKNFSLPIFKSNQIISHQIYLKGTLVQIWKSDNVFVFMWIYYVEDFTSKHLLPFKTCVPKICEKIVYNIHKQ